MFSLANIKRHLNDQGGFSLAEVVMAVFLFTSAVVGVSGLVISGGADVARGASESLASNMANKKIEAVRSLAFYRPWSNKNQDIDDFYFNTAKTNAQQLDNPGSTEDYGTIPGASAYKRTTAVQYQVVSGSSMAAATMADNWVPKEPSSSQVDRPTTKAGDTLHSLIVEVAVYYRVGGQERVYRQRTLAGDMIIPGGSSIPTLLVKSIDPTTAAKTQTDQVVKVTVEAQETLTGTFDVRLWASGTSDIVGTGVQVISQHEIDAHFNLAAIGINPGLYNISVYWKDNGWIEKSFRNCFTITGPVPTISSISSFKWGYKAQSSRQVTISGTNLANATYVQLVGPYEGGTGGTSPTPADSVQCPGSIVSATSTKIVANFNLTSVPDDSLDTHWTVQVGSWGGLASSNSSNRVLVNPPPQVTSVTCTPTTLLRKCSYTNAVLVTGKYFQSGVNPAVRLSKVALPTPYTPPPDITGGYASSGTVTETDDAGATNFTLTNLDLRRADSSDMNRPIKALNSANELGDWYLYVTNQDGQDTTTQTSFKVTLANATPAITSTTTDIVYNDWDRPFTINGSYFDPDYTTVKFYDDYGLTGTKTFPVRYGTGQTIGGLVINTIGLTNTTYSGTQGITVTDTENGLTSSAYSYAVSAPGNTDIVILAAGTTVPSGCIWPQANPFYNNSTATGHDTDTAASTNVCYEGGPFTYSIIAQKMKNSGVRWYFTPSSYSTAYFDATITYSRQYKWVLASGSITWSTSYTAGTYYTVTVKASNNSGTNYNTPVSARIRILGK